MSYIRPSDASMKVLSVRLNEREAAQLEALCERTGVTASAVMKQGMTEMTRKAAGRKSLGQLAREMGLVGCFAGPPDLAERHGRYVARALRKDRAKSTG